MSPVFRVFTFLAPSLLPVYQTITRYLARHLSCAMELHAGQTYDDLARADFSFICGLPYVLRTPPHQPTALLHTLAAPVLAGERYQSRPIYFSDVIVHRDSLYQSFADLRGCSWAYNEPESQSGYGITRYHLVRLGETNGYFGQVIQAGFHHRAIHMVASRQVDAAAIDSHTLAIVLNDHPELAARIRIVESLGPSTIQPFAAAAHIAETMRQDTQNILTEMHADDEIRAALARGLISRFAAVNDSDYDDIRGMLAACERANFWTLR